MLRLVIFDMDEVLYDYDHAKRLAYLSALTGQPAARIHDLIWESGFEDRAEAGAYDTADAYLAAYGAQLGFPLSKAQWIEARRVIMRRRPHMLELADQVARSNHVALLTNNGMLLKEALGELAPDVVRIFGRHTYVSAEFGTKKPDPAIYGKLIEHFDVPAHEALFIDDKAANVEGARRAGLNGHHFTDADRLRAELAARGLIARI